jgi:hypothetical protein
VIFPDEKSNIFEQFARMWAKEEEQQAACNTGERQDCPTPLKREWAEGLSV